MKPWLLFADRDLPDDPPPPGIEAVAQDLNLETIYAAMAAGDPFLHEVVRRVVSASLRDPSEILYRQAILADCLAAPAVVREVYDLAVEAINRERREWGGLSMHYPEGVLHRSVRVLEHFVDVIRRLRRVADERGGEVRSAGLRRFYAMIAAELDDAYLATVDRHLRRLRDESGVLMTAGLGQGNRGTGYVLRRLPDGRRSWRTRIGLADRPSLTYTIAERDESGMRALGELRGRGVALAAAALGQSTDHILGFFGLLRFELGFYVGCLNLADALAGRGQPTCFPEPVAPGRPTLEAQQLYDAGLALTLGDGVVGNDVAADGRALIVVTGANRGGKSTFLRALGLAQLMMQAGMFVAARSFRADLRDRVLTHFKREEDASLESGKLDEELGRMSDVVDHATSGSLVLLNESFASTNEREGSEIARQIVHALLEAGVKVGVVTHLYDLARSLYDEGRPDTLFLRAERLPDGRRTFRLIVAEPLPTSFGRDVYRRVFEGEV